MMSDFDEQQSISFEDFCHAYKELLASNGLSHHLLKSLHHKLENEIFDAGDYFCLSPDKHNNNTLKVIVSNQDGVEISDPNSVFLIDHSWTYKSMEARKQLCECPGLLPRIAQMMGYSVHGEAFSPDDDIVNNVLKETWKYNQSYSISSGSPGENIPFWYFLDEFGTCIRHADSPSVLVFPFFYQPKQISFSIMCMLVNLNYGDEVTRDYANYEKDSLIRKCKLLPWFPQDMSEIQLSPVTLSDQKYEERYKAVNETLPDGAHSHSSDKKRLKIYIDVLSELLDDVTSFEIVDDESEADVIFTSVYVTDYEKLSDVRPDLFVCQFPCEQIIFLKDFFADIARRAGGDDEDPVWFPQTFSMLTQFPQFISTFQKRAKVGIDKNIWIMKPSNVSSNAAIHVSDNLDELIRLKDSSLSSVVSEYIERPVLITLSEQMSSVKFALRYFVLVKSINPLKMHVCELFIPTFACKTFELSDFDDQQRHVTSLHYSEELERVHDLPHIDFIQKFENQHSDFKWTDVNSDIHMCIFEFMKAATSRAPPYGVGHYVNSRAIYGFNVMLQWKTEDISDYDYIQPMLLGCNFMPDLTAACQASPAFLSQVLRFLFLEDESCQVTDISDLS